MKDILYTLSEAGSPVPATFEQVIAAARGMLTQRFRRGVSLNTPRLADNYLIAHFAGQAYESFCCLFIDTRYRLIAVRELFRGTLDSCAVYTREVVKEALQYNAHSVLLAHCHPSGVTTPSPADELITLRLKDALSLIDVGVADHIIVAGGETYSMAEHGLL
jgi:DNA repair protein RadC